MFRFVTLFILGFIFCVLDGIEIKSDDQNVIIAYLIEGSSIENINKM